MKYLNVASVFVLLFACHSALGQDTARSDKATRGGNASSVLNAADLSGLCIQVGVNANVSRGLSTNPRLTLHCFDNDAQAVEKWNQQATRGGDPVAEYWPGKQLPLADNLVNHLVVTRPGLLDQQEALRVVCPGGAAYFADGDSFTRIVKPWPASMDAWTHQWHGADGGLVSNDTNIDVPQGVRWLSGPLFAMAGRKSSTQSLVSVGGRNFYVTQNVTENVGQPEMSQYLVARDAFNGLLLWQRPWQGPFVTGDGETNPRIVASADRLYIAGARQVAVLDTKTGETLGVLPTRGEPEKLALTTDLLLVQTASGVLAADPDLKAVLWEFSGEATPRQTVSEMVVTGQKVFVLVSGRSADGNFRHDLTCLNLSTGKELWRVNTQPQITASRLRINFAADEFVALQAHGSLHMFSAEDGRHLWTKETDARPGKDYVDERFVGHFYRLGLVWMLAENSPREPSGQNTWLALDPRTGEVQRRLTTTGDWPRTATPAKMGCQLLIASDRYIMIPRQATFIDLESGEKLPFKFVRGGCGLGFVPANGLVYSHPHACGCFSEAIRGFMAMHSTPAPAKASEQYRLQRGPAYNAVVAGDTAADDWPMHRHDWRRGAVSPVELSGQLSPRWSMQIASTEETASDQGWRLRNGNRLTPATVVGQTAYVADVNRGRLAALDMTDGKEIWGFQASGRIDSPPTIHQGRCLFGAHDGYIYCLDAKDGRLAWRFRAAPQDQRIVAYGGVESIWPVAGSVLVRDGLVWAAAGRAPDADGGIEVIALKLESGEPIWSTRTASGDFQGICDFLVGGEDEAIYLANWRYDARTGEQVQAADSEHLRGGKAGLLETSWTKHDLALRKDIQTWSAAGAAGQLLAFSPALTAAYDAEAHQLIVAGQNRWSLAIAPPAQLTGLAVCRTHVVAAGGVDRADRLAGGRLWLLDRETGKIQSSLMLPAEPVFDGLTVARGAVLVATQDGGLHCFESSRDEE